MSTLFTVLHIIVAVLLIVVVLLQEGKDPGMRGISGAAPDTGDSFFSKNTGRTKASMFSKMTAPCFSLSRRWFLYFCRRKPYTDGCK